MLYVKTVCICLILLMLAYCIDGSQQLHATANRGQVELNGEQLNFSDVCLCIYVALCINCMYLCSLFTQPQPLWPAPKI